MSAWLLLSFKLRKFNNLSSRNLLKRQHLSFVHFGISRLLLPRQRHANLDAMSSWLVLSQFLNVDNYCMSRRNIFKPVRFKLCVRMSVPSFRNIHERNWFNHSQCCYLMRCTHKVLHKYYLRTLPARCLYRRRHLSTRNNSSFSLSSWHVQQRENAGIFFSYLHSLPGQQILSVLGLDLRRHVAFNV